MEGAKGQNTKLREYFR